MSGPAGSIRSGTQEISTSRCFALFKRPAMKNNCGELDGLRMRWHSGVMTESAKKLLDEFDALPQTDRQQVLVEILRRAALMEHDLPDEADLVALADQVFLDLDR